MVSAQAAPFAYITNFESNSVSVIDTATNAVIATVPVGTGPQGVAVHPAGTQVYVGNLNSNTISVIDTATNAVVSTLSAGSLPIGVAVHPAGAFLYVTDCPDSNSSNVLVFDTVTLTQVAAVPVGSCPEGITVHPEGTRVYVGNFASNTLSVIDTTTNAVIATVPVGTGPQSVAVHPAGTQVYVGNLNSNTISVIDTATNAVIATVPGGGLTVESVAVHPAGTFLYVIECRSDLDHVGNVFVIDTSTLTQVAAVPVGGCSEGVAVHPAGSFVYVAETYNLTVSVIDTATNTVVANVPVGSSPIAFGQFIGPQSPGVSFNINKSSYGQGDTLALRAAVYPGDGSRFVDAYVAVELPDGTLLHLQADGSFTQEIRPIVSNWPVASFSGDIFSYTFSGNEPLGEYRWQAFLTEPGALNVIGVNAQAPFAFSSCTYAISPSSAAFPPDSGGTGSVSVTAPSDCSWTAVSNANWITITADGGSGNGTVSYTVAANTSASGRSGTLTIAGQTFTVGQDPLCLIPNIGILGICG
jgi:YVTN family beta-propeller protein